MKKKMDMINNTSTANHKKTGTGSRTETNEKDNKPDVASKTTDLQKSEDGTYVEDNDPDLPGVKLMNTIVIVTSIWLTPIRMFPDVKATTKRGTNIYIWQITSWMFPPV